jgi:hypothetical protein
MKHTATLRSVSSRLLVAVVLGAAAFGLAVPSAHAGDGDCTTSPFLVPAVKKACETGKRAAAKKMMQDAKKKWEGAGKDWKCKTCHDASTYKFESDAAHKKAADDIAAFL